ncbi:MAG: methyltransferase domain-containing protein [Planctomycetota bacterium]|nr:methyltransferase domain-containing protein [Planctomycetota bacterium]MDP6762828.1 methyltransferase domain-containing protein [Planctomycetota bacterium]MDP6988494.1 methyltransferase domain-containing protein [Planctomycetota bacterium]
MRGSAEPATVEDAIALARPLVTAALTGEGRTVLEAGCGSCSHFDLAGARSVGIDISASQLERNAVLDERIQGDLQGHDLGSERFDAVVCWYVLEHLSRPDLALANMARSLRPGGVLVLAVPRVLSVKGLVTKLSPHRFHVWVYRHLLGRETAGLEGHPPFPTYLRWSMSPPALRRFAAGAGFDVVLWSIFEDDTQRRLRARYPLLRFLYAALDLSLRLLTASRARAYPTDLIAVLSKRA